MKQIYEMKTDNKLQTTNNEPSGTITNKIAASGLINLSPEDFYPEGIRIELDIAPWLYEGLILREKDFREYLKNHNWQQYDGAFVNIICSVDAIIPQWAYMLLGSKLLNATKVVFGNREALESILMEEQIAKTDFSIYKSQRIILKGCSDLPVPPHAYLRLVQELQKYVTSLMFGEACSTVPIFKAKKP